VAGEGSLLQTEPFMPTHADGLNHGYWQMRCRHSNPANEAIFNAACALQGEAQESSVRSVG